MPNRSQELCEEVGGPGQPTQQYELIVLIVAFVRYCALLDCQSVEFIPLFVIRTSVAFSFSLQWKKEVLEST